MPTIQTRWVTPMSGKADQPRPAANNPFAIAPVTQPPIKLTPKRRAKGEAAKAYQAINTTELSICDDPVTGSRPVVGTKYGAILAALKPGQAIKCPTAAVGHLCGAMRKNISTKGLTHIVRSTRDYGDGMGRVWMLEAPKAPAAKTAKAVKS